MSHSKDKILLGTVLQQAGLVSDDQVKTALIQQKQTGNNLRIGEILAFQGRIDPKTADFFAERWFTVTKEQAQQPIGQYLKQAALLNEQQIQEILKEQQQTKLKFGEMAIAKGWLKPATVSFFVKNLTFQSKSTLEVKQSVFSDSLDSSQKVHQEFLKIKLRLLNLENQDVYSEKALDTVLLWTGGQSPLTQKLFEFISQENIIKGKEKEQIDYLIENKLLNNLQDKNLINHFETIKERLLHNQQCEPKTLLRLYRQVLEEKVLTDESKEQQELLRTGLVIKQQDKLAAANPIYQSLFDLVWIEKNLNSLDNQNTLELAIVPEVSIVASPEPAQKQSRLAKTRNILLLLAFIALLSVFLNNMFKRMMIKSTFAQGNALLQQKSFEQALEKYNELLKTDSNYFQAWTNRGYALAGIQQYEEMQKSCSTATIIKPTAVYAWNCVGEALRNLKKPQEAISAFDEAIALAPNDPILLINKSESLKAMGKEAESLAVTKEAIQVLEQKESVEGKETVSSEFAVALTFLGNGYRQTKQYQEAIKSYDRALQYSSDYFPARIGKGISLNQSQQFQQAQNEFRAILNNSQLTDSNKAQAWFYLGDTLCASEQKAAGVAAFDQAIKLQPSYEAAKTAQRQCN
ncbi:tetratricopeptide repeat protein [Pleurocapsa sp. FMAR1]|uniref:tetratricopeptide repeat protein n=1 Tax=Pleurocapsa sp. FMAR1 TaxID=3040204 RepID=UPI0029C72721|nr:tetratricopeptide repeat protein [Pleurocapsa sp. FMAR1]